MPNDSPPPGSGEGGTPAAAPPDPPLTDTQRQILVALCRPCVGESRYATPATNQQIAGEVFLSVDAVKAHLRALYRKFGVEPLPHNQKRARLVELVLERGILGPGGGPEGDGAAPAGGTGPPSGAAAAPPPGEAATAAGEDDEGRPWWMLAAGAGLAIGATALVLAVAGAFSSDSADSEEPLSRAEYTDVVKGYCGQLGDQIRLIDSRRLQDASTTERAVAYLTLIDAFTNQLESAPPPPDDSVDLERFRAGLRQAANLTDDVAQAPAQLDAPERIRLYAELTYATGQVQSGAIGYELGPECAVLGRLLARSAVNVSGGP